jgi:hypothetical protein
MPYATRDHRFWDTAANLGDPFHFCARVYRVDDIIVWGFGRARFPWYVPYRLWRFGSTGGVADVRLIVCRDMYGRQRLKWWETFYSSPAETQWPRGARHRSELISQVQRRTFNISGTSFNHFTTNEPSDSTLPAVVRQTPPSPPVPRKRDDPDRLRGNFFSHSFPQAEREPWMGTH